MKLTKEATQRIANATARAVRDRPAGTSELSAVVASAVGATAREILDLVSKEIDPLKGRKAMTFRGAYDPGEHYQAGDVTQRSGAAWVCMVSTYDAPGSSLHWRKFAVSKD